MPRAIAVIDVKVDSKQTDGRGVWANAAATPPPSDRP